MEWQGTCMASLLSLLRACMGKLATWASESSTTWDSTGLCRRGSWAMKRSANLHVRKRHAITSCLIQKSQKVHAMRMPCSCYLVARRIGLM